jgi:hypothetical protein
VELLLSHELLQQPPVDQQHHNNNSNNIPPSPAAKSAEQQQHQGNNNNNNSGNPSVNEVDGEGNSVLLYSAMNDDAGTVQLLLEKGAKDDNLVTVL